MNTRLFSPAILALAFVTTSITAHAQGSLTPPAGAPAPSSHTLNEVYDKATTIEGQSTAQGAKIDNIQSRVTNLDSRKPLIAGTPGVTIGANGTITISSPGSYYLTANKLITTTGANGIAIFSRDVTLDLNGFSLQCGSGTGGSAILIDSANGTRQIHICNGFIRGGSTWNASTSVFSPAGWTNGISGAAADVSITNVTINGMRSYGINCLSAAVSHCTVSECGDTGIAANLVKDSRATSCVRTGISGQSLVDQCVGEATGTTISYGVVASSGVVTNCKGYSKGGTGVSGETVGHCNGSSFSGTGIEGGMGGVDHCFGSSTSGVGINSLLVSNSMGTTVSGTAGIDCAVASYCIGRNQNAGSAIRANNAIGCAVLNSGTISSPQKHLGTP